MIDPGGKSIIPDPKEGGYTPAISASTQPSTGARSYQPKDETAIKAAKLDEILADIQIRTDEKTGLEAIFGKAKAKSEILKHYISKQEVEEALEEFLTYPPTTREINIAKLRKSLGFKRLKDPKLGGR